MKKTKFKMTGNGSGTEKSFESSCLCASLLKKDAGVVEGDFNTETQRLRGTEFKMTEMGLIPEDWEVKRLGEIASFETATIDVKNIDSEWYIGTENMVSGKAGIEKNLTSIPYRLVREYKVGDVLISNIRPYLKKIWLADRDGGCSSDVLVVRTLDSSVCLPTFLKMLLSDDLFFDFVMANAVGTKMPRGDKKVIVNYEVCLPPLAEQKKIAEALSDVDELLAAMTTLTEKKRAIKQGAMQELLTGKKRLVGFKNSESSCLCASVLKKDAGVVEGGFNTETQRRRGTEFKMTEIGLIPEDWEVKKLGEICENVRNGYNYDFREHGTYPMSRIETISSGEINYKRVALIEHEPPSEYKLKVGDILYSHINSLPYIGNIAQYDGTDCLYHGMNLLLLRPTDVIDYVYLKYLLKSETMRSKARSAAKVAINQASISTRDLSQFQVAYPPLPEQRAIAEVLSDMDAEIEALEAKRAKYESIKQGMMQELLTGKTRLG